MTIEPPPAPPPAWYECAKTIKSEGKYTGKYSNKTCTEGTNEGKYELQAGIGKAKGFKGKSVKPAIQSKSAFGLITVHAEVGKTKAKLRSRTRCMA